MELKWQKSYLKYMLLAFCWMGIIFYLSHQPAAQSDHLSMGIAERLIEKISHWLPGREVEFKAFHHFVRKNAHFVAYFLLGIFVLGGLNRTPIKHKVKWTFLVGVLFAASDEFHQLYVPGRSGQVSDVILDTCGVLCGIGVYKLLGWGYNRFRRKAQ